MLISVRKVKECTARLEISKVFLSLSLQYTDGKHPSPLHPPPPLPPLPPSPLLLHPLSNIIPRNKQENNHQTAQRNRNRNHKVILEIMLQTRSFREIHAKVSANNRQRSVKHCNESQDHHEIVRAGADGVEDQGADVGSGGVHLFESLD
jgi:hypothetical protein